MRCKPHLPLCLRCWNADASHTQNLAKLARLRRPRHLASKVEPLVFNLRRGLRRSYVSPSPCSFSNLHDRDALPFNRLTRNFKRNSTCYDEKRRNFDRIELRRRGALQNENSKAPRRSRADSVETLRVAQATCVQPVFDPHLCPKPLFFSFPQSHIPTLPHYTSPRPLCQYRATPNAKAVARFPQTPRPLSPNRATPIPIPAPPLPLFHLSTLFHSSSPTTAAFFAILWVDEGRKAGATETRRKFFALSDGDSFPSLLIIRERNGRKDDQHIRGRIGQFHLPG